MCNTTTLRSLPSDKAKPAESKVAKPPLRKPEAKKVHVHCALLTLGAHAQRGLQYLSSLISDLAQIHVQQEIPTASALHG